MALCAAVVSRDVFRPALAHFVGNLVLDLGHLPVVWAGQQTLSAPRTVAGTRLPERYDRPSPMPMSLASATVVAKGVTEWPRASHQQRQRCRVARVVSVAEPDDGWPESQKTARPL